MRKNLKKQTAVLIVSAALADKPGRLWRTPDTRRLETGRWSVEIL